MRLKRPHHSPDDFHQMRDCLLAIEDLTPPFQAALTGYLCCHDGARPREQIAALLDVDRLSAAYLYWTRLFPPRQPDESMFVLSLLHDLGERVYTALRLLDGA